MRKRRTRHRARRDLGESVQGPTRCDYAMFSDEICVILGTWSRYFSTFGGPLSPEGSLGDIFIDLCRFPGQRGSPKMTLWNPHWDTFLHSGHSDR